MQIGVTTTIANRSRSGVVADSMQIDVTTTRGTSSDTAPEHTRRGLRPTLPTDTTLTSVQIFGSLPAKCVRIGPKTCVSHVWSQATDVYFFVTI